MIGLRAAHLLEALEAAVVKRNNLGGGVEFWTISDWILAACVDKLNHTERSRKSGRKLTIEKIDSNGQKLRQLRWSENSIPALASMVSESSEIPKCTLDTTEPF